MENIFKISKRGIIAILTLCILFCTVGNGVHAAMAVYLIFIETKVIIMHYGLGINLKQYGFHVFNTKGG